jgi:hypothetical protein
VTSERHLRREAKPVLLNCLTSLFTKDKDDLEEWIRFFENSVFTFGDSLSLRDTEGEEKREANHQR